MVVIEIKGMVEAIEVVYKHGQSGWEKNEGFIIVVLIEVKDMEEAKEVVDKRGQTGWE